MYLQEQNNIMISIIYQIIPLYHIISLYQILIYHIASVVFWFFFKNKTWQFQWKHFMYFPLVSSLLNQRKHYLKVLEFTYMFSCFCGLAACCVSIYHMQQGPANRPAGFIGTQPCPCLSSVLDCLNAAPFCFRFSGHNAIF